MTSITMKCQLRGCKHFIAPIGPKDDPVWICDAFPLGIPADIINGSNLHNKPMAGDGGIQFAAGGQTYKHLAGRHDQKRHGLRAGGEASSTQLAARKRSKKRREDQKQKPNTNSQTVSVRPEDVIKRVREKYAAFDENSVEYQRLDRAMDNIYESRREYHNNNTRDNLINLIGDSTYGEYGRDAAILTMEDLKWNNDGTITLYRGGALGGQSWSTNIEWAKRFSVYGFGGPGGANPSGSAKLWKHNFTIDQLIVAMPWEGEVLVSKDAAMLGEEIGY